MAHFEAPITGQTHVKAELGLSGKSQARIYHSFGVSHGKPEALFAEEPL
jgi:hypothetical protein